VQTTIFKLRFGLFDSIAIALHPLSNIFVISICVIFPIVNKK
jgi:hypothetical protein